MITILSKIQKDSIQMRKEKNPLSGTLVTVLSEAKMVAKNDGNREVNDSDVIKTLTKTANNIRETIKIVSTRNLDSSNLKAELALVEAYLPKQLSDTELKNVIRQVLDNEEEKSMKAMGRVMAHLKTNYEGQYDGKRASGFVKEALNG